MKVDALLDYKGQRPDVTKSRENGKFWNIKWYDAEFSEFHQFIVVGYQNVVPTWNKFVMDSRSNVTMLRWILAKIGVR